MSVFDFALRMEQDGKALYDKLASETREPELKTIFNLLGAVEQEHYDAIKVMQQGIDPATVESTALEKVGQVKNSFRKLLERKDALEVLKGDPDGFEHVLKAEEESIRLYKELATAEKNPAARKLLLEIAAEEEKHLNIIENIYEFVERPHTYLAWGEFSNLAEY